MRCDCGYDFGDGENLENTMLIQQQLPNLIDDTAIQTGDAETAEQLEPAPSYRFSRLASAGKAIGSGLLGVGFLAVILLAIVSGGKIAAQLQPWVQAFSGVCLLVLVPVSTLLLLCRSSRGYGGVGLYFASFPLGFSLWVTCFVYALTFSVFWAVAGVLLAGLGIVPIAAIMTLIRKDWSSFGGIIGTVLVVFVLRGVGAWIAERADEWTTAAKNRARRASEHPLKRGNYLVRHWRGQLSLGVSYWVDGLLATFVVGIVAAVVGSIQTDLRTQSALMLLVFAFAVIASIWQSVGVWRSASNHFARGGTLFWAGVAKVMVIVGFLSTSVLIWQTYIPQSAEFLSIIRGDTNVPAYQIQVLPGGTEIEFRGGLRAGSARELERILSAVPRAKVLHIESPGGRIAEAKQMMRLVHQRSLTTYTSEYCLSAATLVLMAGKERVIAADAKVGFHAGSFPGLTPEQQSEMNQVVRATMQSAGVSEEFTDRVLATPADQMWYPSFEEMKMNGVVTSQSFGERFALPWAPSDEEIAKATNEIDNLPWFRTVRALEPKLYAKMIDEFTAAIKAGKPEGEAISIVRANGLGLMEKYFPAASDEALLGLLRDEWIPMLTKYGNSNSPACIAVMSGGADSKINFWRAFPDWDMPSSLALADAVLRSGASKIPVGIDKPAATSDLERIFKSLTARYGNDVQLLAEESEWMNNSQKVCEVLLAMYQQISALPTRQAANVVRYLVTASSNAEMQPGESATSNEAAPVATRSNPYPKFQPPPPDAIVPETALAFEPPPPSAILPEPESNADGEAAAGSYRVVNVKTGDVLNLHAGPGSKTPVIAVISPGTPGITLGNGRIPNGTTMWQEIYVDGHRGWVNEIYIEPELEIRKAKPVTD
jgi:hypothetical protein